jgi:hypothetical protein
MGDIVFRLCLSGLVLNCFESRKEPADQNRYDCDHDQQLDEVKPRWDRRCCRAFVSNANAYDIDLPVDKVPNAACQIHGGSQWPFAQQAPCNPEKAASFPGRLFKSFRRLFGAR